jgi:hypothetical protein
MPSRETTPERGRLAQLRLDAAANGRRFFLVVSSWTSERAPGSSSIAAEHHFRQKRRTEQVGVGALALS